MGAPPELAAAIKRTAGNLGINPSDLATAISYETNGTFDPWQAGPTTQWGQHRGLIQWGEPQRAQYGVTKDTSVDDQMRAVENYLRDRGLKPGSGMLDVYSTINAGRPGLYDRSDAGNGGAPGTVADKVATQSPAACSPPHIDGAGTVSPDLPDPVERVLIPKRTPIPDWRYRVRWRERGGHAPGTGAEVTSRHDA